MWDYLDDTVPGYQDTLVLHMIHKPIIVCLETEEDKSVHAHLVCACVCTHFIGLYHVR